MADIVVIGAGFGGIATATYLARAGHDVTVLEKNDQLGGRAGVLVDGEFRRDMGPSWYLMPDLFEQYFADFDKDISDYLTLTKLSPSYKVFFTDSEKSVPVYDQLEKNAAAFEQLEPGAMEKLEHYLEKAAYQYQVAMEEFVPKNYDSIRDFFTWKMLVEGTKLNVFTSMDKYVRRYFKTPEMQKIMQYPLVFLGTAPHDAPALYNIMSRIDFGMGVYYPQGGIRSVVTACVALAESYGVNFETEKEVTKIVVDEGVAKQVVVGDRTTVAADIVISNADMRWTETKLLDRTRQSYPASYRDSKKIAPSAFILYLGIAGSVDTLEHHTLLFAADWQQNFYEIFETQTPPTDPSLYVCCPSKTDPTVAPEGHENIFILVPFPPGVTLDDQERGAYREKILDLIETTTGSSFRDRIVTEHHFTSKDFHRRYHAYQGTALGLAHTLKQTAIFRPNNVSKRVENLFYTGAYTNPGIGMPMCLLSGKLTAKRIVDDL